MEYLRKFMKNLKITEIPEELDDDLETIDEYKSRWMSVRIIYFTMFLMSLAFSIVLTGIWPFLDKLDPTAGKVFMGIIVAANPFGQMIFSPLFGYWGKRTNSIRFPLLSSLLLFIVASAFYSSLEMITTNTKYWMLGSRFVIGISAANIAVCRSYLSAATRIKERTGAVSMVSLAQVLGFVVGPGLQAAVTPLGETGYTIFNGFIKFNMYTACGWLNVFMGILNFCFFLPIFFQERKVAAKEVMRIQGVNHEVNEWKAPKPDYISAWTLIFSFFVLVFNFVLLETLATSLTMDQFAWTKDQALYYMGILMSVGAVISCITFILITPLCKYFPEENILIWGGFLIMICGRLLCIPMGDAPPKIAEIYNKTELEILNLTYNANDERYLGCPRTQEWCLYTPALTLTQFLFAFVFTSIGYLIGITLIQTIFSKILGPRDQGVMMGFMTGAGCFSRVLGPIFVGYIYTSMGTYWVFGITSAMMIFLMIWLLIFKSKLIPPIYDKVSTGKTFEMEDLVKTKNDIKIVNSKNLSNSDLRTKVEIN